LREIPDALFRSRTIKQIDKIHGRIGRLKEIRHGIGRHYHIEVMPDETDTKAWAVQWEKPQCGNQVTQQGVSALRNSVAE